MMILASASPRRKNLCAQIGLEASVMPVDIDETPRKAELPALYAKRMAMEKACAIGHLLRDKKDQFTKDDYPCLTISADTVVSVGRRILSKTDDPEVARDFLSSLSGRAHRVYGAMVVGVLHRGSDVWAYRQRLSVTKVHFQRFTSQEISLYLDHEEWKGCAGGYAIQGRAAMWIKQLQGSYTNVVGLDTYQLNQLIKNTKL